MALVCTLTAEVAREPVVSPNGDVYERRAIEKHIGATGSDPVTKQPLAISQLIPLKVTPDPSQARPRTGAHHSVPGLLSSFQNEWDALMLECFNLRQQLQSSKQELSQALYQHDAAVRVIARLLKEKDQLKQEITQLRAQYVPRQAADELPGISASLKQKIESINGELQEKRKHRIESPGLTPRATIQQFKLNNSYSVHKSTAPGVLSLDVHPLQDYQHLTLSGGVDAMAVIFNRTTEKKEAVLVGHSKPVVTVRFHPKNTSAVITASQDGTAKVFHQEEGGKWAAAHTLKAHSAALTNLDVHPLGDIVATSSVDRTCCVHDIQAGVSLARMAESDLAFTVVRFHPDGVIYFTGCDDNYARAGDVRTFREMAKFEGHQGRILDVCCNENGYYMATAAEDKTIKLWDLRNLRSLATVTLENAPAAINYDFSGKFLAAAVGSEIRVFQLAKPNYFEFVQAFDAHTKAVTAVKWGYDAKFIESASLDRTIKVFN